MEIVKTAKRKQWTFVEVFFDVFGGVFALFYVYGRWKGDPSLEGALVGMMASMTASRFAGAAGAAAAGDEVAARRGWRFTGFYLLLLLFVVTLTLLFP